LLKMCDLGVTFGPGVTFSPKFTFGLRVTFGKVLLLAPRLLVIMNSSWHSHYFGIQNKLYLFISLFVKKSTLILQ